MFNRRPFNLISNLCDDDKWEKDRTSSNWWKKHALTNWGHISRMLIILKKFMDFNGVFNLCIWIIWYDEKGFTLKVQPESIHKNTTIIKNDNSFLSLAFFWCNWILMNLPWHLVFDRKPKRIARFKLKLITQNLGVKC